MPELPEVETTLRGLAPHLEGQSVAAVVIRHPRLRWPIPQNLPKLLRGRTIRALRRRAKYLLIEFDHGTLILHLGMSGSLCILPAKTPATKHDHFDLVLANGKLMRLHDPRRFGAVLWHEGDPAQHPLLAALGPEPLPDKTEKTDFDGRYLYQATRGRNIAIKQCIMDSHVVAGIGNIYANEALFLAGVRPQLAAGKISLPRCTRLVAAIRKTLNQAIRHGGSTLRNFVNSEGKPGYFQQHYWVYGRGGEPCKKCGTLIKQIRQGQRSSFYCGSCQQL
ncbi:MAG TPA: bifunctional DNA-formamidopyrimidine glycosylase/DNA-(apurinic or apyrimidinic site) lyase [Gallionella sp.]|jgi:formamidopyrimidine-DNA glycosylase|nr:bifunctional DNA-formamidopyrimidine glycosylase/DNA-(apurinic or apyrimidinic site) lyase [Gallionella sp.]